MLLCVLGLGRGGEGRGGVGGVGITPLYGLSEVWAAPKGMAFGLFICEKGVSFIHIGLIKGVFNTHWTDKGCVFHPGLVLGIELTY